MMHLYKNSLGDPSISSSIPSKTQKRLLAVCFTMHEVHNTSTTSATILANRRCRAVVVVVVVHFMWALVSFHFHASFLCTLCTATPSAWWCVYQMCHNTCKKKTGVAPPWLWQWDFNWILSHFFTACKECNNIHPCLLVVRRHVFEEMYTMHNSDSRFAKKSRRSTGCARATCATSLPCMRNTFVFTNWNHFFPSPALPDFSYSHFISIPWMG